jgi:AraC-like DNA-binding protein
MMNYQEISPSERLKPYVKCYYLYASSSAASFVDTVFPSGYTEIIFNLGSGKWQTYAADQFVTTPEIELWGQIIKPLTVRSIGKNTMLGIRFFSHAMSCFIEENIDSLNNQVVDFKDLSWNVVAPVHSKLLETTALDKRIMFVEEFLLNRLSLCKKKHDKVAVVNNIMHELKQEDFFDNIENVASRYGFTSRYLQKLFLQYTGLTPKLYTKINRFQNSLRLVTQNNTTLTSIAYDCGYFDQSHFIREFKSFTGLTPSGYTSAGPSITFAITNN